MKYSSVASIAFTVYHDTKDPYDCLINPNHLRRQLLCRIADIDDGNHWIEALGFHDTIREDGHCED
jgi:hypothetical protein